MRKIFSKLNVLTAILVATLSSAQLFRNKDRMDNLEGFDNQKFSYGFYLAGNNFDYKLVLDPKFGMDGQKNLVQSKSTYSFGAGLIGKLRLNENFDLRFEPGLQFVERELYFDTQANDRFAAGTFPFHFEQFRVVSRDRYAVLFQQIQAYTGFPRHLHDQ